VPAYLVLPGGGVEVTDQDLKEALLREVREELGGEMMSMRWAFEIRSPERREVYATGRISAWDIRKRSGPELDRPGAGRYIPVEVNLNAHSLARLNLQPPDAKEWLVAHCGELRSRLAVGNSRRGPRLVGEPAPRGSRRMGVPAHPPRWSDGRSGGAA
jgi:hypothetical protein